MTQEEYFHLVEQTYNLISTEIDHYSKNNDPEVLKEVFAKFPVMYEFFRFLRGEAFHNQHPPVSELQKDIYRMENDLREKIKRVLARVDYNDSKSRYYLKQYRKIFQKGYF